MGPKSAVVILGVASAFAASLSATTASASSTAVPFSISTVPALSPAFSAGVSDYAVACPDHAKTRVTTIRLRTGRDRRQASSQRGANVQRAARRPASRSRSPAAGIRTSSVASPATSPLTSRPSRGLRRQRACSSRRRLSFTASAGNYIVIFDASRRAGVVVPRRQRSDRRKVLRAVDHRLGQRKLVSPRWRLRVPRARRRAPTHCRQREPRPSTSTTSNGFRTATTSGSSMYLATAWTSLGGASRRSPGSPTT